MSSVENNGSDNAAEPLSSVIWPRNWERALQWINLTYPSVRVRFTLDGDPHWEDVALGMAYVLRDNPYVRARLTRLPLDTTDPKLGLFKVLIQPLDLLRGIPSATPATILLQDDVNLAFSIYRRSMSVRSGDEWKPFIDTAHEIGTTCEMRLIRSAKEFTNTTPLSGGDAERAIEAEVERRANRQRVDEIVPTQPNIFERLPLEIRLQIWADAFNLEEVSCPGEAFTYFDGRSFSHSNRICPKLKRGTRPSLSLMCASRKVSEEVRYALYTRRTFCFKSPIRLQQFISRVSKKSFAMITKIELAFPGQECWDFLELAFRNRISMGPLRRPVCGVESFISYVRDLAATLDVEVRLPQDPTIRKAPEWTAKAYSTCFAQQPQIRLHYSWGKDGFENRSSPMQDATDFAKQVSQTSWAELGIGEAISFEFHVEF